MSLQNIVVCLVGYLTISFLFALTLRICDPYFYSNSTMKESCLETIRVWIMFPLFAYEITKSFFSIDSHSNYYP